MHASCPLAFLHRLTCCPAAGEAPPARISLHHYEGSGKYATPNGIKTPGPSAHCEQALSLRDLKASGRTGDYTQFDIKLADFRCSEGFVPNKLDIVLDGSVDGATRFCMDDVKLY